MTVNSDDDLELEEVYCAACSGSGEGNIDGYRCSVCNGSGVVFVEAETGQPRDDY